MIKTMQYQSKQEGDKIFKFENSKFASKQDFQHS